MRLLITVISNSGKLLERTKIVPEILSLYKLNQLIKSIFDTALPQTFLVTAEIASLDVKNHCFLTLVDKDKETIRAEMKAVIWASTYKTLSVEFNEAAGIKLNKGIKILFEAFVEFHERYGLKLNIIKIDPSYTIGELAIKRKDILERLTKEGLKDKNKQLEFPLVPQRIGIISSATAAGYEDLLNHLTNNPYGYKFHCRLYEAIMQGDKAEASIIKALNQCRHDASYLDVLVIVRGGGGQADLHCFDNYEIAKTIAFLPLPVISGIGHERDITVVDEVSNTRVKTPTAAADLIITRVKDFEDRIDSLSHSLVHAANKITANLKEMLSLLAKNFESLIGRELLNSFHMLGTFIKGLKFSFKVIQAERERLRSKENNINHLNPQNVLKRGYSITYKNGKAVKAESEVKTGDSLKTTLYKG
ncbi:MAG: exodeoxyribonuclease VII large subunit, partial [Nitrospirota bacterium]